MSKALDTAPRLPAGSVDFSKFAEACAKGDDAAVEKAVVVPKGKEKPAEVEAPIEPAIVADAGKSGN